jgi:hypothetical protein
MKKLANLKGAKALDRNEQKTISGGRHGGIHLVEDGPCGETGGKVLPNYTQASCYGYGYAWANGQCWICY